MTKDFEHAWHNMLNLKYTSDLARGTDTIAIHEKRPRDDSNPWNVAWPSDSRRRLEILGDSKVVVNWMNGIGRSRETSTLHKCVMLLINLCDGI